MNTLTLAQPSLFGPLEGGATLDEPAFVEARPDERASVEAPLDERASVEAARFTSVGGEPTLDDELVRVWEGLVARRAEVCPVCQGKMMPEYGADTLPVGGRCTGCGSTLR